MSRQRFAFSCEDDERSLSPLSLTDREEQQQVNEPTAALTCHENQLSNTTNSNTNIPQREIVRFPCKARNLSSSHNARSAYIDIPPNAAHGTILICSHPECATSGRRFRFCAVCHLPVARRNFADRHSHGIFPRPPRFDAQDATNHPKVQQQQQQQQGGGARIVMVEDAMKDITAKRRAAELMLEDLKVQERLIYMRWGRNPPVDDDDNDDDDDDDDNIATNMGDNNNGNPHAEYTMEHTHTPVHSRNRSSIPVSNTTTGGPLGDSLWDSQQHAVEPKHYMASNGGEQLYQQQRVQPNLYLAGGGDDNGDPQHAEPPNHWDSSSAFSRYQQQQPQDTRNDNEPYSTLPKRHKGANTIFRV